MRIFLPTLLVFLLSLTLGCASAGSQFEKGDLAYLNGNYEAALTYYRSAQRKDPLLVGLDEKIRVTEIRMYLQRGDLAVERFEWTGARQAYEEVRYRDPQNSELPGRLQALEHARADHHYRRGLALLEEGNPFEAIGELEEALRFVSDHSRARATLERARAEKRERETLARNAYEDGRRAWRDGKSNDALELLARAVELDPNHAEARNELAEVRHEIAASYVREGDESMDLKSWQAAIAFFGQALEVDPTFLGLDEKMRLARNELRAEEILERGHAAFERGEWQASFLAYDEAWGLTADRESFRGRHETAREQYALELYTSAQTFELDGRIDDALASLDALEAFHPDYRDVDSVRQRLQWRGETARRSYAAGCRAHEAFDLVGAVEHYRACMQAVRGYRDVEGRLRSAHEDLEQAGQYYERALAAERAGDLERARIFLEECLSLAVPYRDALERLALLDPGSERVSDDSE